MEHAVNASQKLYCRQDGGKDTLVRVGGITIGGREIVVMAGPCAVEEREQMLAAAQAVKNAGAAVLRGGAFKPRTSPYSFQGLGVDGLLMLAEARAITGLPVITEVMDPRQVALVANYADILQIGTRNMQNYTLLREVAGASKPVLLKRGQSATIEEWLLAAEYILAAGNSQVILCERGIRGFDPILRNTLDLASVAVVKQMTHLPVIVDPSHAVGRCTYVPAMARAAVAAGADGLLIEVHPCPERALCDGQQSLTPEQFSVLMGQLQHVARAVGRSIAGQ
ncbi:MAG: 3-deoxy-7-phosphoheptulonate synthase [Desulfurispora sp.]|uniref:3-deoxy-7-phosphoheptulonate synthase n=1 Tax=Desulfurispora sp. TaxID=3014275 RepID=UPI0040496C57